MTQKILFVTPPFVQMNTPYPATSYLKGFLNTIGIESCQVDLGIEVILKLFTAKGLSALFDAIDLDRLFLNDEQRMIAMQDDYINTIDAVISFLQNQDPTLAQRICNRDFLPEGNRFSQASDLEWAFGAMGIQDQARHLATLYLEDISDFIIETVDPYFGFSRYAERISTDAPTFNYLEKVLNSSNTFIDEILLDLLQRQVEEIKPTVVGLSVPFPGNLYSALKCGQWLKANHPEIKIVLGGGYPNTELRSLSDSRIFNFIDYITLDDGEAPLQHLLEFWDDKRSIEELKRTYVLQKGEVVYMNGSLEGDVPQRNVGTPDYSDLPLKKYLSLIETANPMHSLWSNGRWNKLTLAHGCYWGRCTFCDTSLDYIKRFEPSTASQLCDRIENIIAQTGETGFHFVDEAAPPALLKSLALELIKRKLNISWWTNIRFEKSFTADLCFLLKESGCIAVAGGLEVASERLLGLINKGVSIAQVAKTTKHLTDANIMVHAYLMYGFPTETDQEIIDSLEVVRQLFEAGIVQSGFWHNFAMTAHSPIGLNPAKFGVKTTQDEPNPFANNEIDCIDAKGAFHFMYGDGLRKSLYNYMHDIGFDSSLQDWFEFEIPKTMHPKILISSYLSDEQFLKPSPSAKIIWLGKSPAITESVKKKKGRTFENANLLFHLKQESLQFKMDKVEGYWLFNLLAKASADSVDVLTFGEAEADFEEQTNKDFFLFWNSKHLRQIRACGLLVL